MATKIITKNSSTASAAPVAADLSAGELAINTNDGKLFYKDSGGTVRTLASKDAAAGTFATLSASGNVTLSGGTANGVLYLNGSKVATSGSALTFDGSNLATSISGSTGLNMTSSASQAFINLRSVATPGFEPFIGFGDSSAGNIAQMIGVSGGGVRWTVAGSEAMRLTSTGLGIGTSSPSAKLHVSGGRTLAITGNESYSLGIGRESNTNAYYLGVHSTTNPNLLFSNNAGTTNMTLTYDGNLGIGVTPSASAGAKAINIGSIGYVFGDGSIYKYNAGITSNAYVNGNGTFAAIQSRPAGVFEIDDGVFKWRQASSGTAGSTLSLTQAMTLDASGNLLVGQTSSNGLGKLQVNGYIYSGAGIWLLSQASGGAAIYESSGNTGIAFGDTVNTLRFTTSGSERARITSGGELLVGRTSLVGSERLSVEGSQSTFIVRTRNTASSNPSGMTISYTGASPNNAGNEFIYCEDSSAVRMTVRANGGISNYQANDANLSDRKEKTNFAPAGEYLSKICAIPVQTFNYIDQNMEEDAGLTLGVVAQDVQAVAPELVMESNWGTEEEPKMRLSIYQTDLQYALMKSIQELKAELDSVKAELAQLKGA